MAFQLQMQNPVARNVAKEAQIADTDSPLNSNYQRGQNYTKLFFSNNFRHN